MDGDTQHRHLRHTSNGSYGAAASVDIAAGDMDRYTTLRTGTYDSTPPPPACLLINLVRPRSGDLELIYKTGTETCMIGRTFIHACMEWKWDRRIIDSIVRTLSLQQQGGRGEDEQEAGR
jgi:hypothetical protein